MIPNTGLTNWDAPLNSKDSEVSARYKKKD